MSERSLYCVCTSRDKNLLASDTPRLRRHLLSPIIDVSCERYFLLVSPHLTHQGQGCNEINAQTIDSLRGSIGSWLRRFNLCCGPAESSRGSCFVQHWGSCLVDTHTDCCIASLKITCTASSRCVLQILPACWNTKMNFKSSSHWPYNSLCYRWKIVIL